MSRPVVHVNGRERGPAWLPEASLVERAVRETVGEVPPGPRPGAGSAAEDGSAREAPEGAAGPRPAGEISVTFVPDGEMARLNRRYLDRDGPTDVIAFRLGEGDELLGDVYIAPGVAARNARRLAIAPSEEALRLVVHGVLHVLGYEHPEDESRYGSEMYRIQERVLDRLRAGGG